MSEKYLIFGATGSIGSSLAEQLTSSGNSIHLIGRNKSELKNISEKLGCTSTVADVLEDGFIEKVKNDISEMNGVNFLAKQVDLDANGIKDISFELGGEFDNLFLLLGTNQNGKALLSCYISKGLVTSKNLDAGKIIRELGKYIQGGGGGQPFFATAGGKNPDGLSEALSKGKDYIF